MGDLQLPVFVALRKDCYFVISPNSFTGNKEVTVLHRYARKEIFRDT